MDWDKIAKDYPKAWRSMCKYGHAEEIDGEDVEQGAWDFVYDERHLYDFFDDNGVYIEIGVTRTPNLTWSCETSIKTNTEHMDGYIVIPFGRLFPSRTKAEEAGFTDAFGILERRL